VFDPRDIANFILDEAELARQPVTNLTLNKIIYFAHGWHLTLKGEPLQREVFEAWEYGPVLRSVYAAFRSNRYQPIENRALYLDLATGAEVYRPPSIDDETSEFLRQTIPSYLHLTPWQLVQMSHEADGPWAAAVHRNKGGTRGARIPDDGIRLYFDKIRLRRQ
jgi:uncharacterized phage-associated protein